MIVRYFNRIVESGPARVVVDAMCVAHAGALGHAADIERADALVHDRLLGARNCLIDLQRLCSYGHFHLSEHLAATRELLSGRGEAHSAVVTTFLLQCARSRKTWRESSRRRRCRRARS